MFFRGAGRVDPAGPGGNTMTIRSVAAAACATAGLLGAFPAAAACSISAQPMKVTWAGQNLFAKANGTPLVDVKVNGKPDLFVLDSSAAVNLISAKFASAQKLTQTRTSSGATIVTAPSFELAGMAVPNAPFVSTDKMNGNQDGVIGQTFLSRMDVEYDLAGAGMPPPGAAPAATGAKGAAAPAEPPAGSTGGKVMLVKAVGCETSNMAYWAKDGDLFWEIPLTAASNGAPLTEATILVNGVKLTAMFDTTAPFSVITQAGAEKAGVKTTDAGVTPMRGTPGHWLGAFTVNVGGEEMKNAPLAIAQTKDTFYDVVIGTDYFLTHHLYVANSQHKIYATRAGFPGAPMFTAHQPDPSGMNAADGSRGRLTPLDYQQH